LTRAASELGIARNIRPERGVDLRHEAHLLAMLALSSPLLQAEPLSVAVGDSWAMPFAQITYTRGQGSLTGGIIYDWYQALSKQLQRPIHIKVMPPNRVSLMYKLGQLDLRCFSTPAWSPEEMGSRYRWTAQPLLQIEERLVGLGDLPAIQQIGQLREHSIGTVAGYKYPLLEPLFKQGTVKRDDGPNEMTVLEKQLVRRTDYSVVRNITLQYLQAQDARWRNLQPSPLQVSSTSLYCALRNEAALSQEDLAAAQAALLAQGAMQRITDQYR